MSSIWSTTVGVHLISANPIIKLINVIITIIEFILGIRRTGTLHEEEHYISIDLRTKKFWFFLSGETLFRIPKNKITAVKVSTEKSFIFFRSTVCQFYISGVSDTVAYQVKSSYGDIKNKAETWVS